MKQKQALFFLKNHLHLRGSQILLHHFPLKLRSDIDWSVNLPYPEIGFSFEDQDLLMQNDPELSHQLMPLSPDVSQLNSLKNLHLNLIWSGIDRYTGC